MICKVCQATIDDNVQSCPYCGTMYNENVDPGLSSFPDPAASGMGGVDLSKPEDNSFGAPAGDDLGLSEPAQYTDPAASQQAYNNNAAPTGQSVQPDYSQNTYSQPNYNQNNYSQPTYSYNAGSPEMEKEAQTIMTLGIVAIAVGLLCCAPVGPICGGIGLSKYSKLDLSVLSDDSKSKANIGRILCIIGCAVGALSMIVGMIMGSTGTLSGLND